MSCNSSRYTPAHPILFLISCGLAGMMLGWVILAGLYLVVSVNAKTELPPVQMLSPIEMKHGN